MFDDYDYKNSGIRICLKFVQQHDEPMYPWEIAGFLNKLNTSYYKFELLNSICSAIKNGVSPSDIFIFDHSLPLYRRYANLNLVEDSTAVKNFYDIGLPVPLAPEPGNYDLNLFYQLFKTINSFLYRNHVRPLTKDSLVEAFEVLTTDGLGEAEDFVVSLAEGRAKKSREAAAKRGDKKEPLTREDIVSCLRKYYIKKEQLLSDLIFIKSTDDEAQRELIDESSRHSKRISSVLLAFFKNFDAITRPLVIAKVSDTKFRILGRSLVNKKEQTGLELKEISRNSPLKAIIEGGLSLYQTIGQERRAETLHKIDEKIKLEELEAAKINREIAEERLRGEKLKNTLSEIEISNKLERVVQGTDINFSEKLQDSLIRDRINKAYEIEKNNSARVLISQGLDLDRSATRIIDTSA
ncbi:hypothetical protein [Paludibacterium purpuratum]|nr:hypothetical protein [Paludibacterium purpuratum]